MNTNQIKANITKALNDDSIFYVSEHKDTYISKNAVSELLKGTKNCNLIQDMKKIIQNSIEYILLSHVYDMIRTINDHLMIDIQKLFGLVNIIITSKFNMVNPCREIKIKSQISFTYSIYTMLQKLFKDLTLKVEEDFLSNERFDKIYIKYTRGPRVDIIIEKIKLIIEFDERQHGTYEHTRDDKERDNLIETLGYSVLRFKHKNGVVFKFIDSLISTIKEREFLFDTSKLLDHVVNIFCNKGYEKEQIEILVKEQCSDIINEVDDELIGMTPNSLTLTYLMDFLRVSDEEDIEEIKELLIKLDYPINDDDSDNIILSPNAFEQLLSMLDYDKYMIVQNLRKLYIDIKNTFLKYLYTTTKKIQKMRQHTLQTISVIINNSYKRAERDCFTKCNEDAKVIERLKIQLETYTKYFNKSLPKNKKGIIREVLPDILDDLIIGKPIIKEIPELVYTGSNDDYINLDEVETLYGINKQKYKIKKCITECISDLRIKLNMIIIDKDSSIFDNLLLGCQIIYPKKKKLIVVDEENDFDINSDTDSS